MPMKCGAGDRLFEAHDAKVVIDMPKACQFIDGSRLDFVKEGFKQVFKFENPNVNATCGCGESFSVSRRERLDCIRSGFK